MSCRVPNRAARSSIMRIVIPKESRIVPKLKRIPLVPDLIDPPDGRYVALNLLGPIVGQRCRQYAPCSEPLPDPVDSTRKRPVALGLGIGVGGILEELELVGFRVLAK